MHGLIPPTNFYIIKVLQLNKWLINTQKNKKKNLLKN